MAICCGISTAVLAVDFKRDTTFVSPLTSTASINEVFVMPDGKLLVVGHLGATNTVPYIKRLNPDGSIDPTFNASGITQTFSSSGDVDRAWLVNNKLIIEGYFAENGVWKRFARLNLDGSVDTTLATTTTSYIRAVQPDGKLISIGDRTFGSEVYKLSHRLNVDGSHDAGFRITWADAGSFSYIVPLSNGKILIAGSDLSFNGQPLNGLQRLNSDGSLDSSFVSPVPLGTVPGQPFVLPDGKLLVRYGGSVKRLHPDGAIDVTFPTCNGSAYLRNADGSYYLSGCRKWTGPNAVSFPISRLSESGVIDQTLDYLSINSVSGFRDGGNGSIYIFGGFTSLNGAQHRYIARLIADNTPTKARYDFDNDGKTDISVFRPSDGVWYLNRSSAGISYLQWGLPTDKVAAGDANFDGIPEIGVFRDGAWHANVNGSHYYMCLGAGGDRPVIPQHNDGFNPGDDFIARGSRGGSISWFWRGGYSNCWFSNQQPQPFTISGETGTDITVTGDFNGDSRSELGYFRDGYWYAIDRDNYTGPSTFQFGSAGDIPVPGDYDGDRQTDYAIFRPSNGQWWIARSTDGLFVIQFGASSDIPVPADYDGDGKLDVAIYRNGQWWQYRMGTSSVVVENWGTAGDIPIPAQNQF